MTTLGPITHSADNNQSYYHLSDTDPLLNEQDLFLGLYIMFNLQSYHRLLDNVDLLHCRLALASASYTNNQSNLFLFVTKSYQVGI